MLDQPTLIQLPKIKDYRGNLSFFESTHQIPFLIKRVYWIYDVPGGEKRGEHAYYTQQEFIVCLSGSVELIVDNGFNKATFQLTRSYYGVYIPAMHWRNLYNFSTNAVVVIASNDVYKESDYIRTYSKFLNAINKPTHQ